MQLVMAPTARNRVRHCSSSRQSGKPGPPETRRRPSQGHALVLAKIVLGLTRQTITLGGESVMSGR